MQWAYGVTTVPSRLNTTLPITLKSLKEAGFSEPRLFVDGTDSKAAYDHLELPITTRYPVIHTAANWVLSLYELYLRNPEADRFAIFQDDIVMCHNTREYLDRFGYGYHSMKFYWNLYSYPNNEDLKPPDKNTGFYPSNQLGKGALALVFDRPALVELIGSQYLTMRPQDMKRGKSSIDGAIVTTMKNANYQEYVHYPSLVQHIGELSTMGHGAYPTSKSFPGKDFDALTLSKDEPCLVTELVTPSNVSGLHPNVSNNGLVNLAVVQRDNKS